MQHYTEKYCSYERFNRILYGGHANDDKGECFFTFAGYPPIFIEGHPATIPKISVQKIALAPEKELVSLIIEAATNEAIVNLLGVTKLL